MLCQYMVFFLPDTYEDYLKSMRKSESTLCKRKFKKVEKSFIVEKDVIEEDNLLESEFMNLKLMYTDQWKREVKPGHFGAWPKAEEFNLALIKTLGKLGCKINTVECQRSCYSLSICVCVRRQLLLADMTNIFYCNFWIARILPMIGQQKNPFWNIWIRSNFLIQKLLRNLQFK